MLKKKHDKIINIMQLRFFCQVALRGSVSRAADDLFRTQSAITRAIRDLEAALNVTLFERHYSGMVPTEYGKCILPRARRAYSGIRLHCRKVFVHAQRHVRAVAVKLHYYMIFHAAYAFKL